MGSRLVMPAVLCILLHASAAFAQTRTVTMEEAIDLALQSSPAIQAARTQVDLSRAQEITARLRPNPVLQWDAQFLPIFTPSAFSVENLDQTQQYDLGIGYLFERGQKRQRRKQAAQDATEVTRAQVTDAERTLAFNVAQQFIAALLARSNLEFATENLASFRKTLEIAETRFKAGDISQGDFLKVRLQALQFETDLNAARIAGVQALANLRQLVGFEALPADFDVVGDLAYEPITTRLEDAQAEALRQRPDLVAARLSVIAARSQIALAQANGKHDLNSTFSYSHTSGVHSSSFSFNIPLPIFNRNQGEIARTRFAETQAGFIEKSTQDSVLRDVQIAHEQAKTNEEIVRLYTSGYLDSAKQSRDISEFAYRQGAASLLDLLEAERSYRSSQLGYRQALANYMVAARQLLQAKGLLK